MDPLALLLARGRGRHIGQVVAAGRTVVQQGVVLGIDEAGLKAELLARVRAGLLAAPGFDLWRRQLGELAEDLGPFHRRSAWAGCC